MAQDGRAGRSPSVKDAACRSRKSKSYKAIGCCRITMRYKTTRADDAALRQRMKASKKRNDGVVRKDDQWRVTIEAPSPGGKTCVRGVMYQRKKRSPIPCVSKTVVS